MDGMRYRAWLLRSWRAEGSTRVRIECVARGTEVEIRGESAADLAARVEDAFDRGAAGQPESGPVGAGQPESGPAEAARR